MKYRPVRLQCQLNSQIVVRGTQLKAQDIIIHSNICSSKLARICGMSYISQLGSGKSTHLTARNPILERILTARKLNVEPALRQTQLDHHETPSHQLSLAECSSYVTVRLVLYSVDWLIDKLIDKLIDWLIDW